MRDQRKDKAYFDKYIGFEQERIRKKEEKIAVTPEKAKITRINGNLFLYRMNLLIASFSRGEKPETLSVLLDEACGTAVEADQLTYSDALTIVSLSIMLHSYTGVRRVINKYRDVFIGDKLLKGFMTFAERGKAEWDGTYRFPAVYGSLDAFFSAGTPEEKEDALLAFLDTWYDNCEDCSWYDTVDNPHDVYYGYWCFEAAALAKLFKLNEKRLAKSEYFPVI